MILHLLMLSGLSFDAAADTNEILSCLQEKEAIIAWEQVGIEKRFALKAEAVSTTAQNKITFVGTKSGAIVKGKFSQSSLKKISASSYTETLRDGTHVMWTLLKAKGSRPAFLFQQKVYDDDEAFATTAAYRCE